MAMSVSDGILWMRQMVRDSDSAFGLTNTEYLRFINGRYLTIWKSEKRAAEAAFATLAQDDHVVSSSLPTANEILSVNRNAGTNAKAGMERMEWGELRNLQSFDATTGTPIRYACYKSVADETWKVAVHPVPDGDYTLNAVHTVSPAELSVTSTPILGDAEAYWMYRLAAADIALVLGRPDLIDEILKPIPEAFMVKMGMEQKRLDPKRRDETAVI